MTVRHAADLPAQVVKAGKDTNMQVLLQGPEFTMRRLIMRPGGSMPLHTNSVEHEQFVLAGEAHITINNEEFDVRTGDVVFIPAEARHSYQNTGQDDFIFLCLVPNRQDTIQIVTNPAC